MDLFATSLSVRAPDVDGIGKAELEASSPERLHRSCGGGLNATSSSLNSYKFSEPELPDAFEPVSMSSILMS